jgi:hypothetical protein
MEDPVIQERKEGVEILARTEPTVNAARTLTANLATAGQKAFPAIEDRMGGPASLGRTLNRSL